MNTGNRHNRKKKTGAGRIIVTVTIMVVLIACFYNLKGYYRQFAGDAGPEEVLPLSGASEDGFEKQEYEYIEKNKLEIKSGNLMLVNNSNAYEFKQESNNTSVYDKKNKAYKVSGIDVMLNIDVIPCLNEMMSDFKIASGINDIIIIDGYRTISDQKRILNMKVNQLGEAEAARLVARPGYSEHHTGYAFDIGIYKGDGQSQSYTGSGKYGWINANCSNYGFLLRYTGSKSEITGIADEPWHYRYVGKPHANIIKENEFCLEEYIEYLKNYEFGEKHLEYTDLEGIKYEIYYVNASKDRVSIPVPRNYEYNISGNNVDGFIITVKK